MNGPLILCIRRDISMLINRHSQAGFAIVEVLVAVVVLSIGFIEFSRAFRNINSSANQAVAMTKASNFANATMERVMSNNFDAKGNQANGYALIFGGNDYIDIGNVSNDIRTISFWVQASDITSNTDYVIALNGTNYIKIADGMVTVVANPSLDPDPIYYVNAVPGERSIASINSWYHVAITTSSAINASAVEIGRWDNGLDPARFFTGKIDEVRLWSNVRDALEIKTYYNKKISNPYSDSNLKLYYMFDNSSGAIAYDHSASKKHKTIINATWTDQFASWSSNLGREGESTWSTHNDVDDFHTISYVDSDYSGLDSIPASNNFSGLGGQVYVKYVSLNTGTAGTSEDPYTFVDSAEPTDYKQITVKVGIPGTTDSTQIDAIKSAKADQGYPLAFSPYGK